MLSILADPVANRCWSPWIRICRSQHSCKWWVVNNWQ